MVKVVAPVLENCWVIEPSITLVAVSMPTKAVMPMAIIRAVSTARSICDLSD